MGFLNTLGLRSKNVTHAIVNGSKRAKHANPTVTLAHDAKPRGGAENVIGAVDEMIDWCNDIFDIGDIENLSISLD